MPSNLFELETVSYKARLLLLEAIHKAKSGHPGGSLSCVDALTTLYFDEMNIDPTDPQSPDRDKFVLSKGHAAPALYAVLSLRGFFPVDDLQNLRQLSSHLSGHPDMRFTPGIDMSTGSLGQGISAAVGMALASRIQQMTFRTYALLGDGEIEEGQCWEAFMAAAKWKLDNLCVLLDCNGLQIDGSISAVMPIEPIDKKVEDFGWHIISCDGHNFDAMKAALAEARETKGMPTMIILHTIKGKGVSFMENQVSWHGKAPNDEEYEKALKELTSTLSKLQDGVLNTAQSACESSLLERMQE